MYSPSTYPTEEADFRKWVFEELRKVETTFTSLDFATFKELHEEPSKPRTGMVVYADGSDWNPGDGAGSYVYTGAVWVKLNNNAVAFATQAEQETGTNITASVTPGRQQYHLSAAKAWGSTDGAASPSLAASYNISSITDNGPGDLTFNFTVPFSSANYACVVAVDSDISFTTPAANRTCQIISKATGSVRLGTGFFDGAGGSFLDMKLDFACFGDQ